MGWQKMSRLTETNKQPGFSDGVSRLAFGKDSIEAHGLAEVVRRQGVAVIPDFLGQSETASIGREYEAILSTGGEGIKSVDMEVGRAAIVDRLAIDRNALRQTFDLFGSKFMQDLSEKYLGTPCIANETIYVMHETVGTKHVAQDLHFDVQPTLKFFVYLNDVTAENGAFSCVPGSLGHTQEIRAKYGDAVTYENRDFSREHPFSEDQIVPVEGPAGTLIVFTTELWHRAGVVRRGQRCVMRGHTRPMRTKPWMAKLKKLVGFR